MLEGTAPAHLFLAFPFDNGRVWREGRNQARLVLAVESPGAAAADVTLALVQEQPPAPTWRGYDVPRSVHCARGEIRAWDESGGALTVTLRLETHDPSCRLTISGANIGDVAAADLPVTVLITPERPADLPLTFPPGATSGTDSALIRIGIESADGKPGELSWRFDRERAPDAGAHP
jgi:hypothetical protein